MTFKRELRDLVAITDDLVADRNCPRCGGSGLQHICAVRDPDAGCVGGDGCWGDEPCGCIEPLDGAS